MRWLLPSVLLLAVPALAYEPPAFEPGTRLHLEPADAEVPTARASAALDVARVRVFAVVTKEATDPRHASLSWSSETEAALERTWEAWTATPGFDPAEDVLILVALQEREVRIRAGSTWDAVYGLHTGELSQITDRAFVPRARAGDIDGALAATVEATDARFSGLADLPAVTPEPTDRVVSVWPPEPLMPRVEDGLQRLKMATPHPLAIHVAQHLPDRIDAARAVEGLRPEGDEAVAVLWDVRGDAVHLSFGPAWEAILPPARLDDVRRDDEGHVTSATLAATLRDRLGTWRQQRIDRALEARRAWYFEPVGDARLQASPLELDLSATREALRGVDWPLVVAVVDRADREGERRAPDGRPWAEHVLDEAFEGAEPGTAAHAAARGGVQIAVIGEPPALAVSAASGIDVGDRTVEVDVDGLPLDAGDTSPDAALARVIDTLDAAVASAIADAIAEEQAEAAAREARQRRARLVTTVAIVLTILAGLSAGYLALLGWRRRRRHRFVLERTELEGAVEAARSRLDDFRLDAELKAQVRALRDQGPQTAEVFAAVTAALDEVELGVRALERRLTEVDALTEAAPYDADPRVWDQATDALFAPLTLRAAPDDDLFSPLEGTREASVVGFRAELTARFSAARDGWDELLDAAHARFRRLEDDLDRASLDDAVQGLVDLGLPPGWRRVHPYEVRAADLPALDRLRRDDPVAYVRALQDLEDEAAECVALLERIAAEETERRAARASAEEALARAPLDTVVAPDDDPAHTATEARRLDDLADSVLAACADPVEAVEALDEAGRCWIDVLAQRAALEGAVRDADRDVERAAEALAQATETLDGHRRTLAGMAARHDLGEVTPLVEAAVADLTEGEAALATARAALAERRHLDAVRAARTVRTEAVESAEDARAVLQALVERQEAEAAARALVARLDSIRSTRAAEAGGYGTYGRGTLDAGDAVRAALIADLATGGPRDWRAVHARARLVQQTWATDVATARRAHQAALARARAAAAAAAAARRRRSSYSSTSRSSSSSSSWSSSSSSSWSSSSSSSSWSSSSRSGGSSFSSSGRSGGSSW